MADPRSRHWFTWLIVVTAVVTTGVFAHVGWRLMRDGGAAKSFGWSERSHGGVSYVASVAPQGEAASAFRPGDRLVRLNGDPYVARAGSAFHRRALAAGDTYRLRIARDGQEHEYTLIVGRTTRGAALRVTLFLVSLVWCAVGLFIAFARPDTALARLAFAAAMTTGSVFMTIGFFPGVVLWAPLHAVIGYHFFSRFPAGVPPGKAWSRLVPLLYAAGGLAAGVGQTLNVAYLTRGPMAASRVLAEHATLFTIRDGLGISAFWLAVGAMVAVLAHNYRVLSDADQRRRIRWVVYGSMVGLTPSLVWSALAASQFIFGEGAVPWTSDTWMRFSVIVDAASVAIPICIAYAVVKHRVLDIKVAVRAGVQYMLAKHALQLLLVLPIIGLAYAVVTNRDLTMAQLATESTGYLYWGAAAALGLKVRHRLGVWLDRKFFREQYDREQVLLGLIEDLGALDSLSEASYLIRTQLDVALHPKLVDLWYRDADKLVLAASSRPTREAPPLPPDTGLLALLERKASLADVRELRRSELSPPDLKWLDEAEVHLIAPVLGSDERLLGLLLLGDKRSEEPYSASDRRLLQAIARHAGVMRENLQLRGQVDEHRRVRRDVLAHLEQRLINVMKECPSCGTCFDSETDICDRDGHPLTLPIPVERTIDSKYRLDCLIGKGGMGAVYDAWDLRLRRQVAVKILIGHAFSHETAARRFQREARAAARLSHPNIVRVYDYGTLGGDGAYLVMERVHGRTLREELTRFERLTPADAAQWLEQLLDGVAAAHALGIVHRDLKPENIVGERHSADALNVKVLDFGLAKFSVPDVAASGTLTATGLVMGSIGYMSPEQLTGSEVDHRTDIFALGIIVAEVLTGRRPFGGVSHGELLRAVLLDPYHLPVSSAETRALDELLQRCLAKEPEARLESVAMMRAELIPLLRACPSLHPPQASGV